MSDVPKITKKEFLGYGAQYEKVLIEESGQDICFQYLGKIKTYGDFVKLKGFFDEDSIVLLLASMRKLKELRLTLANPNEGV